MMIFLKYPEPGKVKTRIAEVVGDEEAARIYTDLVRLVARNLAPRIGKRLSCAMWIVFDPPEKETEVRAWLEPVFGLCPERYEPQAQGDLGQRLTAAFAAGFAAGYRKIAAIGTDCVDLDAAVIGKCWHLLHEKDVVFGPAEDGGYYLVALKNECAALFEGVPWSSTETLSASKQVAEKLGRKPEAVYKALQRIYVTLAECIQRKLSALDTGDSIS